MTQTAINYAKALQELHISRESMQSVKELIEAVPAVCKVLEAPVIPKEEKKRVADRVFPEETRSFIKLLCDYDRADQLADICEAYEEQYRRIHHILKAEIYSAKPLGEEKKQEIERFLQGKYPDMTYQLSYEIEKKLMGGTLIKAGNMEYDNSYEGRLHQLELKLTGR